MIKQLQVYITEKLQDYQISIDDILKIKNGGAQSPDFLKANYHISNTESQRLYKIFSSDDIDIIEGSNIEKYLGDEKYNIFVKKLDELSKKNIKYSYIEYIKNNDPNNQNNSPFDNNIEVSETDLILYDILLKFCNINKISYVKILPSNSLENKFFIIVSYKESKNKYITNIK